MAPCSGAAHNHPTGGTDGADLTWRSSTPSSPGGTNEGSGYCRRAVRVGAATRRLRRTAVGRPDSCYDYFACYYDYFADVIIDDDNVNDQQDDV